ncbi:hypothetical protein HF086_003287 [Spodoptera exigua]|uniref:Uncharacterized protein n=1 Tax=Spodoptera exigua TaxID=7107 RepID=A0A922SFZ9_SPOEX|nr:hypothetical protein HF086_003287 [Spodoptera exigua]
MILAGVLPIPVVLLLRRFQCLQFDVDIHQGSIRRIETTVSTKEMMSDQDSSDSEDNVRTTGRFEDSSSSDEEILNTNSTKGNVRRLAMKPIGRKPTTFKMDVVDE